MKIAVAQIKTDPGFYQENKRKILGYIDDARGKGAELVVFPELCVNGYAHMDLVFQSGFVEEGIQTVQEIAGSVSDVSVIVGFVDQECRGCGPAGKPVLSNSAAVLSGGRVIATRDKTLLPEYDIFSEQRYFTPGSRTGILSVGGRKTGIGICEDMWDQGYANEVYPNLLQGGAELLINISASPFHAGKRAERISVVSDILTNGSTPFVYANLVGAYDGYDGEVVFDGQSLVFNREGKLCAVGKAFEEQLLMVDVDTAPEVTDLSALSEAREIGQALILGIKDYFRRSGFSRAYVGLSGGIDSAVVATLCVDALGAEKVVGVTMPSHITSEGTLSDAHLLANNLGIRIEERPISSEYQAWLKEFQQSQAKAPQSLTRQNKQARIRGAILMEYSNEDRGGIVVSTGNKTELALGYCTLYGDMCGGFAAISDLSKERVYAVARALNLSSGQERIPSTTIDREPTAELEPDQTDAANLPADYDVLSPLVDAIVDEQRSREELIKEYPKTVVDATLRLVRVNEFKRRQAAPGIRITPKAFGIGRRIPMIHGYGG
jgi:NAD+ synthetase